MVIELCEVTACLYPAFLQGLETEGSCLAVFCDAGFDEVGIEGHSERGFHLARVVVFFCEDLLVAVDAHFPPVAEKDKDVEVALELADEGFKIVAAVAVDDDEFSDAVLAK